MATPTQEEINNLWQRLIEINKLDMQPGDIDNNAAKEMAKLDMMSEEPVILSYQAGCSNGQNMTVCPENNIFFNNIVMQDTSLGYPSKILGPNINDEATNAEKNLNELITAQENIQVPESEAPIQIQGATHYIDLPPGDEDSFAVLRAGFISAGAT